MKIGDKVKVYCDNLTIDSLIGIVVLIDEGWEGNGTVKVRFKNFCSYNHITKQIIKHGVEELRFNPEELKIIK